MIKGIDKKGWTKVSFGEVCRNLNITERDPEAAGIDRYVGLEHIEPGSLHIKTWGNVADGTTFTKRFSPGHVLFGKRRAYQRKAAVADFAGICSGDILVFEAIEEVMDPDLLPFLVHSDRFFDYAVQTSAGSLSPRTKFQDLAKFEFLLPPKAEQARLAELLWAADDLLERCKQLNISGENAQKKIRDLEFERLAGKEEQKLSLTLKGKSLNGIYKNKDFHGRGTKMVNMGEMFAFPKLTDADMQLVELTQKEKERFLLEEGDLLFARRSLVIEGAGKCSIVISSFPDKTFESSIIRLRPNKTILDSLYCFHFFKSKVGIEKMRMITSYTTVAGITSTDLVNLKIPMPNLDKQKEVVRKIEAFDSSIDLAKKQIQSIRKLKQNLSLQIFSDDEG